MRAVSPELRARLDAEAAAFCRCWRLIRRDGFVRGFTDHDRDLVIDGLTYECAPGFETTRGETALGFAVGGAEIAGALVAEGFAESDLAAGLYDGASVETWLVDWQEPRHRLLLSIDAIGEVRRSENAFSAELRSLAHELDQERGRVYQAACDADLGDARCGLDRSLLDVAGVVAAVGDDGSVDVEAGAWPEDWFTGGSCRIATGAAAGATCAVRAHRGAETQARLSFWEPPPRPLAPGDAVVLTAGCDKSAAACREKFGNFVNFRGCPHIPGDDVLLAWPKAGDVRLDGGSLYR